MRRLSFSREYLGQEIRDDLGKGMDCDMGRFWNKDVKRIAIGLGIVVALGGVLCNLVLLRFRDRTRREEYEFVAGIMGAVQEKYPQVAEEELLQILRNTEHVTDGEVLLRRYGFLKGGTALGERERGRAKLFWQVNLVLWGMIAASICLLTFFWQGRRKRLQGLCDYVARVSRGDYNLEIRENQEDELSGLKNELYKLAVLYREQADHANAGKKALSDAVANISHQLKTPLTSAVVLADNLVEDPEMEPETRRHFLQEISRQLIGMKWLVVTLLKLSRLDAGVVELQKERLSLKKVMESVLEQLEMMAEWKEISFQTDNMQEGEVVGDEKWIAEALLNIVKNAVEHSPQKGTVEISIDENDVYSQVVIRDHGPGIPEKDQKHLFERFYRASKVENENAGIGLALAKEIVERHGGYVSVESDGAGTAFSVKFLKRI